MIADWASHFYTRHRARIYSALGLGVLGIAASVATIYALPLEGTASLGCGVKALSCTTALTSDFAKIAGIPLGIFGVFYFAFWTLNLRAFQLTSNSGYLCVLSWITLVGAAGSVTLFVIMAFVLRAPCLYCLLTHLANLGSFALLWPVRRWRMDTPFTSEQFRHFAALTAVATLGAAALHFASRTRHLTASLRVRETALHAVVAAQLRPAPVLFTPAESPPPTAAVLIEQPNFATALAFATQHRRPLAIGFYDPG